MAKFSMGQLVYSAGGTAYHIDGVYDSVAPHPTKGVRYGVQQFRDGKRFGPSRNLWDSTAFATNPNETKVDQQS